MQSYSDAQAYSAADAELLEFVANQLASSLNDCAETIKLQTLTWRIDDPIISKQNLPQVPYFFIKELRTLNNDLHVKDDKFHERLQANNLSPR